MALRGILRRVRTVARRAPSGKQSTTVLRPVQFGGSLKLGFSKRRKTEQITVETEQIVIIRRHRVTRGWCGECQNDAYFIPLEEINRLVEAGIIPGSFVASGPSLHLGKSRDGSTVFCANSLVKKA